MATNPCTAAAVAANIYNDCISPATAGLQTLAICIAKTDITYARGTTQETKNIVPAITLKQGKKPFVIKTESNIPYETSNTVQNADTKLFDKTVNVVLPDFGAEVSSMVIEPMCSNSDGYVFILQRKREGDGKGSFLIVGLEKGAVVVNTDTNLTADATRGCATLLATETGAPSHEIYLYDTDYQTSKETFDALAALADYSVVIP